jgi:hypothetical protein
MDKTGLGDVDFLFHGLPAAVPLEEFGQLLFAFVLAEGRGPISFNVHHFRAVLVVALGQSGLQVTAEVVLAWDFDCLQQFVLPVHEGFIGRLVELLGREEEESLAN